PQIRRASLHWNPIVRGDTQDEWMNTSALRDLLQRTARTVHLPPLSIAAPPQRFPYLAAASVWRSNNLLSRRKSGKQEQDASCTCRHDTERWVIRRNAATAGGRRGPGRISERSAAVRVDSLQPFELGTQLPHR